MAVAMWMKSGEIYMSYIIWLENGNGIIIFRKGKESAQQRFLTEIVERQYYALILLHILD